MVGRGVMIDIAKQMGVDSLQAGHPSRQMTSKLP